MTNNKQSQKNDLSTKASETKTGAAAKLTWFVVVVFLISGIGALVWYGQRLMLSFDESLNQTTKQIEATASALSENNQVIDSIITDQKKMTDFFKTQVTILEQLQNKSITQQQILTDLQNQVALIPSVPTDDRNNWLVSQAKYFLTMAQAELSLFGNQTSAQSALRSAQRSIQLLPGRYLLINQAIELALSKLDPEGSTIKKNQIIARLQNVDSSFVLLLSNKINMNQIEKQSTTKKTFGLVLRAAGTKITKAIEELIIVRTDGDARSLKLSKTQEQIMKSMVSLNLNMARIAILQNNDDQFQSSLEDCEELIKQTLSINTTGITEQPPGVVKLLNEFKQLKDFRLKPIIPEIQDAITLLEEVDSS